MEGAQLTRVADVLATAIDAAASGVMGGLPVAAGNVMLSSVTSIGDSMQFTSALGSYSQVQKAAMAQKMIGLISRIAKAALQLVQVGQLRMLSAVRADGKGAVMVLKKESASQAA